MAFVLAGFHLLAEDSGRGAAPAFVLIVAEGATAVDATSAAPTLAVIAVGIAGAEYERRFDGSIDPGRMRPDFSFVTSDGDVVVWEHLGMMGREDYRRGWEWKRGWYLRNGLLEGETLFTSQEDENGGLDSEILKATALTIRSLIPPYSYRLSGMAGVARISQ